MHTFSQLSSCQFSISVREMKMSNVQEIPPNDATVLKLSRYPLTCKFQWLSLHANSILSQFLLWFQISRSVWWVYFSQTVQVLWARKCFRETCCRQSLLTSSCDHSFHITGSFTASLTANKTAGNWISEFRLKSFITICQLICHCQTPNWFVTFSLSEDK